MSSNLDDEKLEKRRRQLREAQRRFYDKNKRKSPKKDPISYTIEYQRNYHKAYYEANKEKIINKAKQIYYDKVKENEIKENEEKIEMVCKPKKKIVITDEDNQSFYISILYFY